MTSLRSAPLSSHRALVLGLLGVLAATVLGVGILLAGSGPILGDAAANAAFAEARAPFTIALAHTLDRVGGGLVGVIVIPLGGTILLWLLRGRAAALYFLLASALSAGLVQLLKMLLDRPRPENLIVVTDAGSFPSGHTANAATLVVVLALLLRRAWVIWGGALYVLLMLSARVLLGAHWPSDTLGGILLGMGSALVLWSVFRDRVLAEHRVRARS